MYGGSLNDIEANLERLLEAEEKSLSWSISFMCEEGIELESVGSVYYSGNSFYNAEDAYQYLKEKNLLSEFSLSQQEKIIDQVKAFVNLQISENPNYCSHSGYKASPECYRETENKIMVAFIDDSDQLYFDAIIDKICGNVRFEYLGQYETEGSRPFENRSFKISVESIRGK
ncbi:TPA: hypothetical protein L4613_006341 [Pseudomonas aeruginosa]|nr:hypothetical protein [Pseudomonas aeruginosa]